MQTLEDIRNTDEVRLLGPHLENISVGKARSKWRIPGHPGYILVFTSDRISIFDFVLGITIPDKGMVLNLLNIWWRTFAQITGDMPSDLYACGRDIDRYFNNVPALRNNPWLQARAVVVKELQMLEYEFITRCYLTGSGYRDYVANNGVVCGHQLPSGLIDGSRLPHVLFTPSTKAVEGHDINTGYREVMVQYPEAAMRCVEITERASDLLEGAGIILVDTKMEFGVDETGQLHLADELLTPDSTRFWKAVDYGFAHSQGKLPPSMDKEYVRDAGRGLGINKLDPQNPDHRAAVRSMTFPAEIITRTAQIYRTTFVELTGKLPEQFAEEDLHMPVTAIARQA